MKTLRATIFLSWAVLLAQTSAGQSAKAFEQAGDKAFAEKDNYTAMLHYRDAMERSPNDPAIWYKYAEVARQFNAFEEAEEYYAKAWKSKDSTTLRLAPFWLGQVKKCLGKYQEASSVFEAFLAKSTATDYYTDWAINELNACKWAAAAQNEPSGQEVIVEHLDKKINTPYSEFGAVQVGEATYYSSYRFDHPKDKNKPKRKLSKLLFAEKQGRGKVVPNGFNDETKLTAHSAMSTDGQRIYFTVCDYVNASDIRCELFYREKDKRGRWNKQAMKLPDFINQKGSTATQPSIGYDSLTQKTLLFFTSDRAGGKGKLDIWFSELVNGNFTPPQNLAETNTPENDVSPFFHSASQTLFFSSDGRSGLGGFDVYQMSRQAVWEEPRNLGKPVNSSYHDIYYALDEDAKAGFVSSNRPGSFYLDEANKACCHDIYRIKYQAKNQPSEYIPAPQVDLAKTNPPPSFERLEDFLPLALYFDNDEPDKRTNKTTTKKTYETTFEKYYPRQGEFVRLYTKDITNAEEVDEASLNIADFFENEVKKGFDHLGLFCGILEKRLAAGDRVEIVIKGYTSPRAKSDYNDFLAQRRISSLRNHFSNWKNGVFEAFLQTGKLVISEAPFGESQAAATISDDLFDERNSIYSVGASRERRVEIIEVK